MRWWNSSGKVYVLSLQVRKACQTFGDCFGKFPRLPPRLRSGFWLGTRPAMTERRLKAFFGDLSDINTLVR